MNPLTKRLAWLLALSLGLNLFLLGFGVARSFGPRAVGRGAEFDVPGMGPHGKGPRLFGPHAPALREQRREVLEARTAVAQALTREPFEREALATALKNLRDVTAQGQLKLHEVLIETAAQLPQDEREKLAHSRLLHELPPKR